MRVPLPGMSPAMVSGTVGARLAALFLSFGAGIVAARGLGTHGRGVLAVLIAVPAVFSVVGALGLDTANLRFAGRSHAAFRQAVRRAVVFSATAGIAMAAAWWLAGLEWPVLWLGLSSRLALLSAALCPATVLGTLLASAEVGRGRIAVYNLVTAGTMAVYLAGVLALWAAGRLTVVGCFTAYAASQVLGFCVLLGLAMRRRHVPGQRVPPAEYASYALRAYLPNIAQYGMLRMDVPLIAVLSGTTAVAIYSVALPLAEALLLIPVAVALIMFPGLTSGSLRRADAGRIGRLVVPGTAVLAAVIALVTPVAVPLIYGASFRGSVAVVWCMLPGLVAFSAGRTAQTYLAATDRLRPVIRASTAGVAAGLVGLVVLTPEFGATGAGVADSVGYLAFTGVILRDLQRDGMLARFAIQWLRRCLRRVRAVAMPVAAAVAARRPPVAVACSVVLAAAGCAALSIRGTSTVSAVVGACLLLVTLAVPRIGLYVFAVAVPVSQTSLGATVISAKLLLVLVIVCLAGTIAAGRAVRPRLSAAMLAIALAAYFLVSAVLAGAGGGQVASSVAVLAVPLLAIPLIAGGGADTRHALMLFGFSAACVAVPEVLTARTSLAAAAGNTAVAADQTGALNHNAQGAILVLALAVLLARFPRTRNGLARLALAVALAAVVAGIAYSFSRASYFGALAVLALYALRRSIRGLIGAAMAACCLLPLVPAAVIARVGTMSPGSGLDVSSAVRLDLWSTALRMWSAHPVLGVGYLNFAAQLPAYFRDSGNYDSFLIRFSSLDFAHNTYLTVLAETGIVGALLVGALIVTGWRRAWSAAQSGDWAGEGAVLAFTGIAVCSVFGEVLLVPAVLAAFLLVVAATRAAAEAGPVTEPLTGPGRVRDGAAHRAGASP
jgi:O-antigen/teichoic acid export membrane protein/O-antigen ligase